MKRFLHKFCSRRWGYDAWSIRSVSADGRIGRPWKTTVSTTRDEARELRRALPLDLFGRTEIVKVRIRVEAIDGQ